MSFHWNLSSSEDEFDEEEEKKDNGESNNISSFGLYSTSTTDSTTKDDDAASTGKDTPISAGVARMTTSTSMNLSDSSQLKEDDSDDDDDDDDIDWESADDGDIAEKDENDDDDRKLPANNSSVGNNSNNNKTSNNLTPITIDMNAPPSAPTKDGKLTKKRRRRITKTRHTYSFKSLPSNLQNLILDIHRSHMLCSVSRALMVSLCCSDNTLQHIVHSLLPTNQLIHAIHNNVKNNNVSNNCLLPTYENVKELCSWFFDFINKVENRRQRIRQANIAAGAPVTVATTRRSRLPRRGMSKSTQKYTLEKGPRAKFGSKAQQQQQQQGHGRVSRHHLLDVCSYVSTSNDEDAQLLLQEQQDDEIECIPSITATDKNQLLVSLVRSLGWRARYVESFDPIKRDLDPDHPFFMSSMNSIKSVFHLLNSKNYKAGNKKPHKRQKRSGKDTGGVSKCTSLDSKVINLIDDDDEGNDTKGKKKTGKGCSKKEKTMKQEYKQQQKQHHGSSAKENLSWVEVLCNNGSSCGTRKKKSTGTSSSKRWIHVDPARELFDKPKDVEKIRKNTISYAVAVEHRNLLDSEDYTQEESDVTLTAVRLTDVTPRYANTWSRTLKLRGATGSQIAASNGKCQDSWWSDTIRQFNERQQGKYQKSPTAATLSASSAAVSKGAAMSQSSSPRGKKSSGKEAKIKRNGNQSTGMIVLDNSSDEDNREAQADVGQTYNCDGDDSDHDEKAELRQETETEALPTSKVAFKSHPLYVIASVLNSQEVLSPDAKKRVCGVFKGELVYRRSDVSTARTQQKWLYQGRKVKEQEIGKPVKKVKARKKANKSSGGFAALKSYSVGTSNDGSEKARERDMKIASTPLEECDGMNDLYGIWQTRPWSPPRVGPNDPIPVNEYKNVELKLINPGLVHMDEPRISVVAKKLALPYAPCLLGFEGHKGNLTPTIRGIVVHEHNVELLREAYTEFQSHALEQDNQNRQQAIYKRWKKLIVEILTKDRLEREYGEEGG